MSTRPLVPEPLAVSPALIGAPLAAPSRRAAALGIDLLVLGVLACASGYLLALALLGLAGLVGQALRREGARPAVAHLVAGVLVLGALFAGVEAWQGAGGAGGDERAASAWADEAPPPGAGDAASAAGATAPSARSALSASKPAPTGDPPPRPAAGKPGPSLGERLLGWRDDLGLGFGWGIVYFTLLPAWWSGRTVGKALLGLQIVELTGRPLTPLRSFKRYGGYAAGLATGGLGFLQVLWEPNRQALHDKAAHTVVLDRRPASAAGLLPTKEGGSAPPPAG